MKFFMDWLNSGTQKQRQNKRFAAYMLAVTAALLVIAILTLAIMGIVSLVKNNAGAGEPEETGDPTSGYKTVYPAANQLYSGDLILLNDTYTYNAEANADVAKTAFGAGRAQVNGSVFYYTNNQNALIEEKALAAFNEMMLAFNAESGDDNVYVYVGEENIFAAGNTFEMRYYYSLKDEASGTETVIKPITNDEKYDWLFDNAYKYGFVQLYSAEKASTDTAEDSASEDQSHIFRYVGKVHSNMMKEKKCATLGDYLSLLKEKTTYKSHFRVTVDKVSYEVYYIASGSDVLVLEKHMDNYTISGNNMDGYIVTVCTTKSSAK